MTRTEFLASICAIPFIGKLFKPEPKYIPFGSITEAYPTFEFYGTTRNVLGYGNEFTFEAPGIDPAKVKTTVIPNKDGSNTVIHTYDGSEG